MSVYAQELRRLSLETPLGTDALLVTGFNGTEQISRLFSYQLDLLSELPAIHPPVHSAPLARNAQVLIWYRAISPRF